MTFWRLALRNLGRNRKRNLATGSAIVFGFVGILLLIAYNHRAANYVRVYTVFVVHTGHLAIFAPEGFENFAFKPARYSLTPETQAKVAAVLRDDPEVQLVERQIRGQGLIGNGCLSFPFVGQGYEPAVDRELRANPEVKQWMPRFQYLLQGDPLWAIPDGVLLSRGLALALGKTRTHSEFGAAEPALGVPDCTKPREQAARDSNVQLLSGAWAGNISAADGEVSGLFTTGMQETDNSGLVAGVGLLQKLFATENVTEIAVWLRHPERIAETKARLEEKLRAAGANVEILRWDEERLSPYYVGTVQFLNTLALAGALVMAAVISLSVLNGATMTILERSQEIGMYRSMGFRRRQVKLLYLQESLWLSVVSLLAGVLLGLLAIRALNAANIHYHPPGIAGGLYLLLVLPAGQAFLSAGLILALVSVSTWFAISRRLRPHPADLLIGVQR